MQKCNIFFPSALKSMNRSIRHAKSQRSVALLLVIHDVSNLWMIRFCPRGHRWEKWVRSSKVSPGGRVEIENVTFCKLHFSTLTSLSHLWTLCPKSIIQIFDTSWIDKDIKQYIKDDCFWDSCISSTIKSTPWGGGVVPLLGEWWFLKTLYFGNLKYRLECNQCIHIKLVTIS